MHFQLRNLVWATSRNDVFVVHDNVINHWSPVSRTTSAVLNLAGGSKGPQVRGVGRLQVSTTCVREGIIAAGGFTGGAVHARIHPTCMHAPNVQAAF